MRKLAPPVLLLSLYALASAVPALAQEFARAPACRPSIRTIRGCPDTGCGGRGADPLLNRMKNRTEDATNPETLTLGEIRQLTPRPTAWRDGQDRATLARTEGRAVVTTGFLIRVTQSSPESTNCDLRGAQNVDNHLDLVSERGDILATAVTAEITPRVRRERRGWDFPKLRFLQRNRMFVRVTGWLMLDTEHIRRPLSRSTNWEVHPVTEFEVCTGEVSDCRRGEGWVSLTEWQVPRRRPLRRRGRTG